MAAAGRLVEGLYTDEVGFLDHALWKGTDDTHENVLMTTSHSCAAEPWTTWRTGPFVSARVPCLERIEEDSIQPASLKRGH